MTMTHNKKIHYRQVVINTNVVLTIKYIEVKAHSMQVIGKLY